MKSVNLLPAKRYMSLYAKVVTGLAVSGTFDYLVPADLASKARAGCRVWIDFGRRRSVGYIVGLARQTLFPKIKPIIEVIDETPVLDKGLLKLTKELSDYYCCCWGEVIEAALPLPLRKGRKIPAAAFLVSPEENPKGRITLLHERQKDGRWQVYLEKAKSALSVGKSVIFLASDIVACSLAADKFRSALGVEPAVVFRNMASELEEWLKLRDTGAQVLVGTRAAVFVPVNNIGLMIIDNEEDSIYKQDQVPHYHARNAAMMRSKIEGFDLIMGSLAPSLESMRLVKAGKIDYLLLEQAKEPPQVKVVSERFLGTKRGSLPVVSRPIHDALSGVLQSSGKVLVFLNRKGFATQATCHNCGAALKCPRCSINLVYHFKKRRLCCRYCNFQMEPVEICPLCKSGYIKYSGIGVEKIESEICRLFPQARIIRAQEDACFDGMNTDIYVATQQVIKQPGVLFDLTCVLSIDNLLNRVDLRASEKAYTLLCGLCGITRRKMIIQSGLSGHHIFKALENHDPKVFYAKELGERKQLKFPPFGNLALVKLRGPKEEVVSSTAKRLFDFLVFCSKGKGIEVLSIDPADPLKLRGKFWWQITLRASTAVKISKFLKKHLKEFKHSGIIVTVDVDPL